MYFIHTYIEHVFVLRSFRKKKQFPDDSHTSTLLQPLNWTGILLNRCWGVYIYNSQKVQIIFVGRDFMENVVIIFLSRSKRRRRLCKNKNSPWLLKIVNHILSLRVDITVVGCRHRTIMLKGLGAVKYSCPKRKMVNGNDGTRERGIESHTEIRNVLIEFCEPRHFKYC